MATASSPTMAPARSIPAPLIRYLPAAVTIAAVAVLMWVVYDPWYMNFDARYALDWARDVWGGHTPDFEASFAPTPHPFSIALSFLALPFGQSGSTLIVWLVMLGFGALVWLTYLLGARLFNPWVGAVAALLVATRPALLRDTLLDYQDLWFMPLIVGAAVLEARRPRRGVAVLALLAVAGTIRPEAWVLSGLYWLWLWPAATPRQRLGYAALMASAPLLWCAMDLIVTGDPLHSLHGTAQLAEENERRRSVLQVPRWTAQYYAFTLREPFVVGLPIGLFFAWRYRRRRSALPIAIVAAMTAVFAVGPVFGLPLIGRYLRTPSVFLALFYGLAVFGWMLLPRGSRERRVWKWLGVVAALASLAWLPWHVSMLHGLRVRSEREGALYSGLRSAGQAPAVRAAFARCAPLSAADHRPVPYVRWWLDGDPGSVNTVEDGKARMGRLLLVPRQTFVPRWFYKRNFPRAAPPKGYRLVFQDAAWRVWAAPGC